MAGRIRVLSGLIVSQFMVARYLLASICALAGDMLVFLALGHLTVPPVTAAFGGYVAGMAIHWIISVRFVFLPGQADSATHIHRIGFVLSALLGMAITMGMVGALNAVGIVPALAKLASIPVSFFAVYAIRKYGVFAAR
jgi:putative flippase GtrA